MGNRKHYRNNLHPVPALAAEWAADPSKAAAAAAAAPAGGLSTKVEDNVSTATKVRQWLMTGVSYMIPFVAAGGILSMLSETATSPTDLLSVHLTYAPAPLPHLFLC